AAATNKVRPCTLEPAPSLRRPRRRIVRSLDHGGDACTVAPHGTSVLDRLGCLLEERAQRASRAGSVGTDTGVAVVEDERVGVVVDPAAIDPELDRHDPVEPVSLEPPQPG